MSLNHDYAKISSERLAEERTSVQLRGVTIQKILFFVFTYHELRINYRQIFSMNVKCAFYCKIILKEV